MESETRNLILILGPTAVGKSLVGFKLALRFGGEIIACDSMQVYKGFDIGTDKPSPEIRKAVPHHLLDVAEPSVQFTAADFVSGALQVLKDIRERNKIPFIVGGTGLYVNALLDGLFPGPGRNPEIRRKLEAEASEKGLDALFERLLDIDPVYAQKIRRRDKIRIIRALEVYETVRKPMTELFRGTESFVKNDHLVKIGLKLDRPSLAERIENRVDRMFEAGLVEETSGLLKQGVKENAPAFRALGYNRVLEYFQNKISLKDAIALTKLDTRHYAKRQMTWFRKMKGIAWFFPDDEAALEDYVANNIK